jgi:hypothetical protein
MIIYPPKPKVEPWRNVEYFEKKWEEEKAAIDEALFELETLRQDLGDTFYHAILKNRSKVAAVINQRKVLRDNARLDKELRCSKSKWHDLHVRLKQPLPKRMESYKNTVINRIKLALKNVLNVSNYSNETITRDDTKPYYIQANCTRRSGWGRSWSDYEANLPFNWLNTPATKVMEAFDNKFFVLQCRREIELDRGGASMYWINRAVRTSKVGFKEPEQGYAAINDNGFTGFGKTPELAFHSLNRDIAKAAKARLLATLKS